MESSMLTSLCSSSSSLGPKLPPIHRMKMDAIRRRRVSGVAVVASSIRRMNSYGSGRIVDEGMIALRKRIHEMKVIENNYAPPSHWFDWEKQIYTSYDDIICRSAGVVQTALMDLRPSVAIAVLTMIGMSVPTSVVLLALRGAAIFQTGIAAGGCL